VDSAAKLHYNNDIVELHFSDSKVSYVDVAGVVVNRIRLWAKTAMLAAVEKHRARAPSILLVSGLVKVCCCVVPQEAPILHIFSHSVTPCRCHSTGPHNTLVAL